MNLVIPMAGKGSRFANVGYTDPKPLIKFLGKTMIEHVVDAFPIEANLIFLVLKEHEDQYNVSDFLDDRWPGCHVVIVDEVTEGAACTVLLAKHLINNDEPLAIMNSDNIVEWDATDYDDLKDGLFDGMIMVFNADDPKWSYVKLDENGYVSRVVEKEVVSSFATAGIYFWGKGYDFVNAAEQMIAKNIRVNGEFYVAPVYTQNVAMGHKIVMRYVESMDGVGTPEDLDAYIEGQE